MHFDLLPCAKAVNIHFAEPLTWLSGIKPENFMHRVEAVQVNPLKKKQQHYRIYLSFM